MEMVKGSRYTSTGRLADVIALIQLLALAPHTRRSEQGIAEQLKGKPQSADTWIEIGQQHNEFFRVGNEGKAAPQVSLIARVVQEPEQNEAGDYKRAKLSHAELSSLLNLAVQLYDKETQKSEFWKRVWIPSVIAAVSTGVAIINMVMSAV